MEINSKEFLLKLLKFFKESAITEKSLVLEYEASAALCCIELTEEEQLFASDMSLEIFEKTNYAFFETWATDVANKVYFASNFVFFKRCLEAAVNGVPIRKWELKDYEGSIHTASPPLEAYQWKSLGGDINWGYSGKNC